MYGKVTSALGQIYGWCKIHFLKRNGLQEEIPAPYLFIYLFIAFVNLLLNFSLVKRNISVCDTVLHYKPW